MEECEADGRHGQRADSVPLVQGVVEEFGRGRGVDVPGVAALVRVFRISSDGDGRPFRDASIDAVNRSEGIGDDFVICESLLRAGLERRVVTSCGRIKGVNATQEGVGVFGAAAVVLVCVSEDVLAVPEGLEEAEDLWCDGTSGAGLADLGCQCVAFYQCSVLDGGSEEAGALHLWRRCEPLLM